MSISSIRYCDSTIGEIPANWLCEEELENIQTIKNLAADYYHGNLMQFLETGDQPGSCEVSEQEQKIRAYYAVEDEEDTVTEAAVDDLPTLRQYLCDTRGHSIELVQRFKIGLSDGNFCEYARDQGYSDDDLIMAGFLNPDTYQDYWEANLLLYPHYVDGQVSHFSQKDPSGLGIEHQAKTVHRNPMCTLYNQDICRDAKEIMLVEGENDLHSAVGKGQYQFVVATNGGPKRAQIEFLKSLPNLERIILAYDTDKAGRKHTGKAIKAFAKHRRIKVFDISSGYNNYKDIDEYLRDNEHPKEALELLFSIAPKPLDPDAILKKLGIEILGEQEDRSVLLWNPATKKRFMIKNIGKWSKTEMMQDLGQGIFEKHILQGKTPREPDDKISQDDLREAVAYKASESLRINAANKIGQGIWKHSGQFLIVNGACAYLYDGNDFLRQDGPCLGKKLIEFDDGRKWIKSIREQTKRMDAHKASRLHDKIVRVLRQWNWTNPADCYVVTALIFSTYVQSCWTWRPLVSITGASDCGKSTLLSELLKPLFGDWTIVTDRATEAGLRQRIGCDSTPVLIDEFDRYKHRQGVFELFRTASRGGSILRGTADQTGREFGVKHIAWFAAIESGDVWGQDRNRFIRFELQPPTNRGMLSLPGSTDLAKLREQIAATALWAIPAAMKLADKIKSTSIEGVPGRLVENFSVPAAMCAVLRKGRNATESYARRVLHRFLDGRSAMIQQAESEESMLLQEILSATMRVSETIEGMTRSREYSVAQLLEQGRLPRSGSTVNQELEAKGIKLMDHDGQRFLYLNHAVVRKQLLSGTRWQDSAIDQILVRNPGARREQQRCAGLRARGVVVPWSACLSGLSDNDASETAIETA